MLFHNDEEQQSIRPQPPCARRVTAASHRALLPGIFSGPADRSIAAPSIWRNAAVTRAISLLPLAALKKRPRLAVWHSLFEPVQNRWVSYPRFRESSTLSGMARAPRRKSDPFQIRHRSNNVGAKHALRRVSLIVGKGLAGDKG